MYEEFFGFKRRPFSQTPSANGCVMLPGLKTELERCCESIKRSRGPALIVGASGCGKSTLLALIEQHFSGLLRTVTLGCAAIGSRVELIQSVLFEMGLPFDSEGVGQLRLSMIDHFKSEQHCPGGLLLLVDEAHGLSRDVLEELRMITNLVCSGRTQVRLVMAGCHELEENLSRMESFSQRIGVRSYLHPMSHTETMLFVLAQTQMCGVDGRSLFQPSALQKLHDITGGVHRLVCQVCDIALRLAADNKSTIIKAGDIELAWRDLQQLPAPANDADPAMAESSPTASTLEFGSLAEESDTPSSGVDSGPSSSPPESVADPEWNHSTDPVGSQDRDPAPVGDMTAASVDTVLDDLLNQLREIDESTAAAETGMPVGNHESPSHPAEQAFDDARSPALSDDGFPDSSEARQEPVVQPDARELFGADFEQEEQVFDIQGQQLADQNRSSAQTKTGDLRLSNPPYRPIRRLGKPTRPGPVNDSRDSRIWPAATQRHLPWICNGLPPMTVTF